MITRRGFFRWLGALALAGASLGSYAVAIEPGFRLRVQRWRPTPPGWPVGYRLRVAALADLHAGAPHMAEARIARIVEAANALEPDLIVLLGDYAAGHRFVTRHLPVAVTAQILAGLRAPLGVYGVLGNHDWWDDLAAQRRGRGPTEAHAAFDAVGVPILENAALRLSHAGAAFWLVGLGDQLAFPRRLQRRFGLPPRRFEGSINPSIGVDDARAALAQVTDDAPIILLAHEPDIFPHIPDRVAVTLSGHTHGGQIRLFGWSPALPSAYGQRYGYGLVNESGHAMVVSGGLGCSIAPVRFGMPPEITLIELGADQNR